VIVAETAETAISKLSLFRGLSAAKKDEMATPALDFLFNCEREK
jgi:hypothetical protein